MPVRRLPGDDVAPAHARRRGARPPARPPEPSSAAPSRRTPAVSSTTRSPAARAAASVTSASSDGDVPRPAGRQVLARRGWRYVGRGARGDHTRQASGLRQPGLTRRRAPHDLRADVVALDLDRAGADAQARGCRGRRARPGTRGCSRSRRAAGSPRRTRTWPRGSRPPWPSRSRAPGACRCGPARCSARQEQQPGALELRRHVGDLPLQPLELGERPAADDPLVDVAHRVLERALRGADAHGGVAAPLVVEVRDQRLERLAVRRVTRRGARPRARRRRRRRRARPRSCPAGPSSRGCRRRSTPSACRSTTTAPMPFDPSLPGNRHHTRHAPALCPPVT